MKGYIDMKQGSKILVRRYNIYSGLEVKTEEVSICVDPAKIMPDILTQLEPDIILISHESMDHLDPVQVYYLQKKRNAKIFCSIAVAVDLQQYYSGDIDFIDSIQVMLPGSIEIYKNVMIFAEKSLHCDYMLPLIFKMVFKKSKISIIHCIDSLITEKLIGLTNSSSIGIIPLGIAKGIDSDSGIEFMTKLDCSVFIPNHYTNQLERCIEKINELDLEKRLNSKFIPLEWNQYCEINESDLSKERIDIELKEISNIEDIIIKLKSGKNLENNLLNLIHQLNCQKGNIIEKRLLNLLIDIFDKGEKNIKAIVLMIFTIITLYDSFVLEEDVLTKIRKELVLLSNQNRDDLKASILFFLGVYSQQSQRIRFVDEVFENANDKNEYITYWVVECLGRMAVSRDKINRKAVKYLEKIVEKKSIYNSLVVRRKIFWEFMRISKFQPSASSMFIKLYEGGLTDFNPDVRLLAIICIGYLCRTNIDIEKDLLDKMSNLFRDEEDDVRETYAYVIKYVYAYYPNEVKTYKDKILALTKDINIHVKIAAKETMKKIGGDNFGIRSSCDK
ncbi:MBL fold metallo-hydrolase [Eubacterium sp.]